MRIDIAGRHLDLTESIEGYVQEKASKMPRYYDGVERVETVLEFDRKNVRFSTEFRVEVEKHDTFVASAEGGDIYESIDLATDKMTRQLTDFKEKLRNSKR